MITDIKEHDIRKKLYHVTWIIGSIPVMGMVDVEAMSEKDAIEIVEKHVDEIRQTEATILEHKGLTNSVPIDIQWVQGDLSIDGDGTQDLEAELW